MKQKLTNKLSIICLLLALIVSAFMTSLVCFAEAESSNTVSFHAGYDYNGYGKENGYVNGSTSSNVLNSESYLESKGYAESNEWNILESQVTGDSNYYLSEDTELSFDSFVEDTEFSGIIDGCGYTLTINCQKTDYNANSSHVWGALVGTLTGTIKNIRIVTNFNWQNTKDSDKSMFVGGVCGAIDNGIVNNCYIECNIIEDAGCNFDLSGKPTGGDECYKALGGLAGRSLGTSTIYDTTIKITNLRWRNTNGGNTFGRPDCAAAVGGLIGISEGDYLTMTNISMIGSGDIDVWAQNGSDGGKTDLYLAGLIGRNKTALTINGVKYGWTGTIKDGGGYGVCYKNSLVGKTDSSIALSNIFYSINSYAASAPMYSDGTNSSIINGIIFMIDPSKLGFVGNDIWIGELSSYTKDANNNVSGQYVESITFDSPISTASLSEAGTEGRYIPAIAKTSINESIKNYTLASYITPSEVVDPNEQNTQPKDPTQPKDEHPTEEKQEGQNAESSNGSSSAIIPEPSTNNDTTKATSEEASPAPLKGWKKFKADFVDFFAKKIPDFFTKTIPNFFNDKITGFFTKKIPDFFKTTFVDFFVETIPNFFNNTFTKFFTETIPSAFAPVKDFFATTVPEFFKSTFVDFFKVTIPNFFTGLWTNTVNWFKGV